MSKSGPSRLPILGAALAVLIFVGAGLVYFYAMGQQEVPSAGQTSTPAPPSTTYALTEVPAKFEVGAYSLQLVCNGTPCAEASSGGTETTSYVVVLFVYYGGSSQMMTFVWPLTTLLTTPSPPSASVFSGGLDATWSANSTGVYVAFTSSG